MSNKGSGFVKYSVTAVACSVMTAAAFSFLVFSTDVIVNVDVAEVEQAQMLYDRTSVSTVVDIIEDSGSEVGDTVVSPIPGVEQETLDTNFIDFCLSIDFQKYLPDGIVSKMNEEKAYACLACYKACINAGMSPQQSVGLLACACCEGTPCLVQYDKTLHGVTSSASNPLYIKTVELVQAAIDGDCSEATGAGTAQWTGNRLGTYAKVLSNYVKTYGEAGDYTVYWYGDYAMYYSELTNEYNSLCSNISEHMSTPETILVYSFFKYEAGFGNYNNSDSISSYDGWKNTCLNERLPYAQAFYDAFEACGTPPPAVPREGDLTP